MIFDYNRKPTRVQIFGKDYDIPTKTAFFVNETKRISKEISESDDEIRIAELTLQGIALFLGDEFIKTHYSKPAAELDTDEIGALWLFLTVASAKATEEVLKAYASD